MIRFLYNLFFPIGLLLFLPGYLLKMRRRGNYRRNFGQRFGFYAEDVRARLRQHPRTWIHAVSVGEVAIALKLAAKLRELDPTFSCVLTTTTTTAFAVAESEAGDWIEVMYNPLDFWPVVQRAYAVIRPDRVVLVEAEVWPNLAAAADARAIPLALVNARLSPRSERRFQRFRRWVAPTFRCLDLVCVQEERDIARWEGLGVRREVIKEVGSIKYDPAAERAPSSARIPIQVLRELGIDPDAQPIVLGGSTHAGEEQILAEIWLELRAEFRALLLIVAPRHAERTPEIRAKLEELGLRVALRSTASDGNPTAPDCLILDTTGELRNWYTVATVVFIGKSLTARGGQNPVEPIMAGRPVVFGPHMENFASLADSLIHHQAAVNVADQPGLAAALRGILQDPERGAQLVENAGQVLAHHRGATQRTAELVMAVKAGPAAPG